MSRIHGDYDELFGRKMKDQSLKVLVLSSEYHQYANVNAFS